MSAVDVVNRVFREFKRYTGDGLPGEPSGAPLPVGDPQSGVHSPKKSELRAALLAPVISAGEIVLQAEEWAQSEDPIGPDAGGNGTTDRSARYWAQQAALDTLTTEGFRDEAHSLVIQATAGFVGFVDGLGYDFGSITQTTTYFDQDWGSL